MLGRFLCRRNGIRPFAVRNSLAQAWAVAAIRACSGPPAFRIYGRATYESDWQIIEVFATGRRDADSRWPLWRNHCITWCAGAMAVGWDYAERLLAEQRERPASRDQPCGVWGGRLKDEARRVAAGGPAYYNCSELLAHECGHTGQARRFGLLYWPLVAPVTLTREGVGVWHHFENQASETGLFGGIIPGSLAPRLANIPK
jgi:hypothetical protein